MLRILFLLFALAVPAATAEKQRAHSLLARLVLKIRLNFAEGAAEFQRTQLWIVPPGAEIPGLTKP